MVTPYFEKQKSKFYRSLQKRLMSHMTPMPSPPVAAEPAPFALMLTLSARAVAADGDFWCIPSWTPWTTDALQARLKSARLGFYGNMANNHYIIAKALRRLGYQADLVLEDSVLDAFTLNRPFWEDVAVIATSYEDGLRHESAWQRPDFVVPTQFDADFNQQFAGRLSAIPEIQTRYQKDFGLSLPEDKALLLAQLAGYWPYLLTMRQYDVVQFCNAPTMLAPFCPRPYLLLPSGGELRYSAFQEDWQGLLVRAGFRQAVSTLYWDSGFPNHLARLGELDQTHVRWLVDPDLYPNVPDETLRADWQHATDGGTRFIVMPCRQSWADKGNDVFLRAFAQVKDDFPSWRLLLLRWGNDIAKTEALIQGLGLGAVVHWAPLMSKALLRRYQASADLLVDHCLDFGVGSSPIEGMAAGTPVLIRQRGQFATLPFDIPSPPFITFDADTELPTVLRQWLPSPEQLAQRGTQSREWVTTHLNLTTSFGYHEQAYLKALRLRLLSSG
jgi:glycosyltransferase involved in cell wall biosynthesis